jgi:hypothetical protein
VIETIIILIESIKIVVYTKYRTTGVSSGPEEADFHGGSSFISPGKKEWKADAKKLNQDEMMEQRGTTFLLKVRVQKVGFSAPRRWDEARE